MTSTTKSRGLCTTCGNDPTCAFPRTLSRPVVHCEEFVTCEFRPAKTTGRKSPEITDQDEVASSARAAAREMGLCSNCESRETCTFPNARNAVWDCEEYQ